MTLKDHYAPCFKTRASFGAHHQNLNEDRVHSQWRRCSPMTLDSDNICGYSPGFPGKGASYNSGVIDNVFLSGFRTLRVRHLRKWGQYYYIVYYLVEWLWMAWMAILRYNMFTTTNSHWPTICYLFTAVCLLHVMWPAEKCGKRSIANSDPQSGRIFGIRGKSADLP